MTLSGTSPLPTVSVAALSNTSTPAFETSRVITQTGSVANAQTLDQRPPRSGRQPSRGEYSTANDSIDEMVSLILQKRTYTAQLKALKAEKEMLGLLIDTLA